MLPSRHINAQHYYDLLPEQEHQCGDIWSGINTIGLLGRSPLTGLVVTPACDLDQKKTETVTFLPIIPLRAYFSTLAALPEVKRTISAGLTVGQFDPSIAWGDFKFRPPDIAVVEAAISSIDTHLAAKQRGIKQVVGLRRAQEGLRIVLAIAAPELVVLPSDRLRIAFPDWEKVKDRLIRNSYSTDLHFLPSDGQRFPFSGLMLHSLVMFRYPVTVPIEVLDLAATSSESNWNDIVSANSAAVPFIENYRGTLPVKSVRLKSEFLSDLLSRYVTVYNRIGSPDFTHASIKRMISEVDLEGAEA